MGPRLRGEEAGRGPRHAHRPRGRGLSSTGVVKGKRLNCRPDVRPPLFHPDAEDTAFIVLSMGVFLCLPCSEGAVRTGRGTEQGEGCSSGMSSLS